MVTNQVEIVKLHPDAKIPERKHLTDAGFDLYAVSIKETEDYIEYGTGIAINFEKVMRSPNQLIWVDIRPRSSISKYNLMLCNSPGTIDMGYNGEILCRFKRVPKMEVLGVFGVVEKPTFIANAEDIEIYRVGDAIAQLVFCYGPLVTFTEVKELSSNTSNRGNGSFGSTGR
jgi:dUTP pyrophosphatase